LRCLVRRQKEKSTAQRRARQNFIRASRRNRSNPGRVQHPKDRAWARCCEKMNRALLFAFTLALFCGCKKEERPFAKQPMSNAEQIFASIIEGRPNGMPSFRGKIPEEQLWQLVAYVRSVGGLTNTGAEPTREDHMQEKPPENSLPAQSPTSANPPKDHP